MDYTVGKLLTMTGGATAGLLALTFGAHYASEAAGDTVPDYLIAGGLSAGGAAASYYLGGDTSLGVGATIGLIGGGVERGIMLYLNDGTGLSGARSGSMLPSPRGMGRSSTRLLQRQQAA